MIGPEIVYQYAQPKDVSGGTLLIVDKKEVITGTAAALTSTLVSVPADKVLVLSSIQAYAKSQGVDTLNSLAVSVLFEGDSHPLIYQEPHRDVTAWLTENWTGQVWIPPNSSLECSASFSEAISTHVMRFAIHGILIPRGNVQQG